MVGSSSGQFDLLLVNPTRTLNTLGFLVTEVRIFYRLRVCMVVSIRNGSNGT